MKKKIKKAQRKQQKTKTNSHKSLRKKITFFGSAVAIVLILVGIFGFIQLQQPSIPCANSISCAKDLSGKVTNDTVGTFMGKTVTPPNEDYFAKADKFTNVLGAQTGGGEKHVYVDLSAQHLYAFQGNQLIYNFPVSTGKWNLTPTGTFRFWIKLRATLMKGGEGATAYNLPNVPWTMYFSNAKIPKSDGYGVHGEYWFNPDVGLGHPQSHGCVNMRISDAKTIYDWIYPPTTGYTTYATAQNSGTLLTIYGTTPNKDLIGTQFYNNNVSYDAGTTL